MYIYLFFDRLLLVVTVKLTDKNTGTLFHQHTDSTGVFHKHFLLLKLVVH